MRSRNPTCSTRCGRTRSCPKATSRCSSRKFAMRWATARAARPSSEPFSVSVTPFQGTRRRAGTREAAASCWLSWGTQRAALIVGENILGRDPAASVLIDVVGVSRRHAMIAVSGDEVTLRDLASKNGTFANGERVTRRCRCRTIWKFRLGPVPDPLPSARLRRCRHRRSTLHDISRSST